MLSTIIRKFNTLMRISFLDKNTKKYIQLNKKIFKNDQNLKIKYQGIVLVDFFDWNPFIFFWSILSNFKKKKKTFKLNFLFSNLS